MNFPELLVLAVGEGVHGVDDDGLDSAAGPVPKHVVHDRHHVGEALPGARAGRQYAGLTRIDLENRLALVVVQEELLAPVIRVGFLGAEDLRAFLVEQALPDQIVDGAAPSRRWGSVAGGARARSPPHRGCRRPNRPIRGSRILMKLRV